jgi:two-component system, chemotaxis family, CheB/CheR fusion protein
MTDEKQAPEFDALLDYLRRTRGFDFSAYKRASLMRRVEKRMQSVNCERFVDYTDYLEVHPDEFGHLFNVILINVTAFFRDEVAWDFMRDNVVPQVIGERDGQSIRVWSAGCASGEESYSIAMVLAEALGRDKFRERVKIYATDVDDQALNQARQAGYTAKQVEPVPAPLLEKYFVQEGDRYVFDKELRRSVIFGRHDLIQDAPISRVNILACRNALMYFNTEAQARILARFHFALAEAGVLFLGKAEMLLTQTHMFSPVDLRRRIFRKVSKDNWRDRMAIMTQANGEEINGGNGTIYTAAFDAGPHAQIIVDRGGLLVMFNERARSLLNIAPSDIGRPIQDLELSSRTIDLRKLIEDASGQRRPVMMKEAEWEAFGGDHRYFDVLVTPLSDGAGRSLGVSVSWSDASRAQELQLQLNRSKQDLETAYEELQSTNEELETTNEELQSTVEELETTNEELQSTNEELETMNEELQSTNEELQTINEELRERSDDLNRANAFFESILTSVRAGVIVVDRELRVVAWNHRSEDLWGLRRNEVKGQNFLNLDIGLPVEELRAPIRACFAGEADHMEQRLRATNRRGRTIECRVSMTPLVRDGHQPNGVILMIEEEGAANAAPSRVN